MTSSNDTLNEMHAALAKALLKRIQEGSATAADLNVARAFLKDQNISAVPVEGSPTRDLLAEIGDVPVEDIQFN